jgi:glycosyltransferase involved in cell wall biosynthesis
MRVLHIYSGNLYGGIETMLVTLARHRAACPLMEPHFALSFEGRLSEELEAACVPVHLLENVRASRPSSVLRARRALCEVLRKNDFDVVVCHAPWSQAIFGKVARTAGLPLVFWAHDATDGRHWLERWARRTPPDLAICNSHYTASTLSKLFPQTRAEVIYCPVAAPVLSLSDDERRATRAELNTPEDAAVIIQVSRMEAWKGHALHLKALSRLGDVPGWVCWMVGGAQRPQEVKYLAKLKETAGRRGLAGRIKFLGERSDVPRLLAASDIHCQPNIQPEPFGITFIEALYASLPIVTTKLGGAGEIVNDSCGVGIRPNDVQELSTALQRLIQDRDARQKLGRAGSLRARELCDVSTQMRRLHDCLIELKRKVTP